MKEIWKDVITIFWTLLCLFVAWIIKVTVWKTNKENIDNSQTKRIDDIVDEMKTVNNSLKQLNELVQSQHKDLERLKERDTEKDATLTKIQKSLEILLVVPDRLESFQRENKLAFSGLKEMLEIQIRNLEKSVK